MIGNLTETQIDQLLKSELVGRIGCVINDVVYVVPISYAYDGNCIYAHTYDGLKLTAMRKKPAVCFEVDNLKDIANWQSVIAWGNFEEITDKEPRDEALRLLLNRILPGVSSSTMHLGENWPFYSKKLEDIDGIVFKIMLDNKTGKYESTVDSPPVLG